MSTVHDKLKPRLVVDVETFGVLDLSKAGPHAYAEHPDTGVHVASFLIKWGNTVQARERWTPTDNRPFHEQCPVAYSYLIGFHVAPVIAHNWLFEFNIWAEILEPRYGFPGVPMKRWSCTMARALYHGLPPSLELLGDALYLPVVKDKAARANMLKLAKPRTLDPYGVPTWWKDDPEKGPGMLQNLYAYCDLDVEVESLADDMLPELPPIERDYFLMDGRINQRGIWIDDVFVDKLQAITDQQQARLNAEMNATTAGQIKTVNQTKAITEWLAPGGIVLPSLDKEAVANALTNPAVLADKDCRRVLELRREGAKASTAKLRSMKLARSRDGRARGTLQFYGAGRTGRWSGRRIQPQNFPRGTLKPGPLARAVKGVRDEGWTADELDMLFPGTPMDAVASMLRGGMAAPPGRALVSVDLSQIEARVIAWLAGQQDILDVFEAGEDVYTYTARSIGSDSRQLGKVLVLACGFGMGPTRFQETAKTYGLKLPIEEAESNVMAWRSNNGRIVAFWYGLGDAWARVALASNGYHEQFGKLMLRKTGQAVRIKLPSGRELVYQQAKVEDEDGRPSLTYMGLNQYTKKWEEIRTYGGKLAENVTQAVARDIMAEHLKEIENRHGGELVAVGSIHDEALLECDAGIADAGLLGALVVFKRRPAWAPDLPVDAAGWRGQRYRKD